MQMRNVAYFTKNRTTFLKDIVYLMWTLLFTSAFRNFAAEGFLRTIRVWRKIMDFVYHGKVPNHSVGVNVEILSWWS